MPKPVPDMTAGLREQLRSSDWSLQSHGQPEPLTTFKNT